MNKAKVNPNKGRNLVIAVVGLLVILGLAGGGALLWQNNGSSETSRSTATSPAVAEQTEYLAQATAGIKALQEWYDPKLGTWNSTGWWNSANALESVIDYSVRARSQLYTEVISNTFKRNNFAKFLNNFYDDEGWWALAWLKAYDLTKDVRYIEAARIIFEDMKQAWDSEICGGGIFWSKEAGGGYTGGTKNAIPNVLFLTLAARLHLRTPGDGGPGSYLEWAEREWNWFNTSGMLNSSNLVNDGLNKDCRNNGQPTYTYNQGVLTGGLVDLYKATGNQAFLAKAQAIADAVINSPELAPAGILKEPCEPDCGADGPQFKGIFMRNLAYLAEATGQTPVYRAFLVKNARSIWRSNRNELYQFGLSWAGPFDSPDAARQSSALDALNAVLSS